MYLEKHFFTAAVRQSFSWALTLVIFSKLPHKILAVLLSCPLLLPKVIGQISLSSEMSLPHQLTFQSMAITSSCTSSIFFSWRMSIFSWTPLPSGTASQEIHSAILLDRPKSVLQSCWSRGQQFCWLPSLLLWQMKTVLLCDYCAQDVSNHHIIHQSFFVCKQQAQQGTFPTVNYLISHRCATIP